MVNQININHSKYKLLIYIVLSLMTLAVYWQVNQFDFIGLDDPFYVVQNTHIQSGITADGFRWAFSTEYFDLWHPLVWLSFMFDYQLHGLNAGGYHLTNLILHLLSSLLLFWLFNRMTGAVWRSAFVAALFALHPLHVESVAWIAERKDALSAFFWMLTLCLYVYYTERPTIKRYLPVVFFFACALMSKPMVVTLPVVMILLDYWPLRRLGSQKIATDLTADANSVSTGKRKKKTKSRKEMLKKNISSIRDPKSPENKIAGIIKSRLLWEKIPLFILSAVLVMSMLDTPKEQEASFQSFSLGSRLANAPVAFVTYLEKTFYPHAMSVFYTFSEQIPPWQVSGSVLLLIAVSAAVMVMAKRLPYLLVGWLWYTITILPVIGIIQISLATPYAMADRYHYLPSIGLAIMLAWGVPLLFRNEAMRKKILLPAGMVFIMILSLMTSRQCAYWKNSIALFSHALQVTQNNYLAYNNRGIAYANLGQHRMAFEDFNETIRLKPDYVCAYSNRGNAYKELGHDQEAIADYNKAIHLRPVDANAYNNRGITYLLHGDKELGCRDLQKACDLGNCKYLEIAKNKGDCH